MGRIESIPACAARSTTVAAVRSCCDIGYLNVRHSAPLSKEIQPKKGIHACILFCVLHTLTLGSVFHTPTFATQGYTRPQSEALTVLPRGVWNLGSNSPTESSLYKRDFCATIFLKLFFSVGFFFCLLQFKSSSHIVFLCAATQTNVLHTNLLRERWFVSRTCTTRISSNQS